jgi:uncharacterized protein YcbX
VTEPEERVIEVASLHTYPIKSCAGIGHKQLELGPRGPVGDRRCMIVDATGRFLTQREVPQLTLLRVHTHEHVPDRLTLQAPEMPSLVLSLKGSGERLNVEVWRFHGEALCVSPEADAWLSEFLGQPARLVRCAPGMSRMANRDWVEYDAPVSFADGYPILLISEASLADLNRRILSLDPLPMSRFRPNVVVRGCPAFAEDDWQAIKIGDAILDVVKPCDRCGVTTIDPFTAERDKEPLATLATYRRSRSGVLFGQNCTARVPGSLRAGERVEVLEKGRLEHLPDEWRLPE